MASRVRARITAVAMGDMLSGGHGGHGGGHGDGHGEVHAGGHGDGHGNEHGGGHGSGHGDGHGGGHGGGHGDGHGGGHGGSHGRRSRRRSWRRARWRSRRGVTAEVMVEVTDTDTVKAPTDTVIMDLAHPGYSVSDRKQIRKRKKEKKGEQKFSDTLTWRCFAFRAKFSIKH